MFRTGIFCFLVIFFFINCAKTPDKRPYVLMISFDGFRYDYVEKFNAPNFKRFIQDGVGAEYLIPVYPTKTFPNHYSIVTGLYPENHGLVDNTFYDKSSRTIYRISNRKRVEDPYYYDGTPLWQLVQDFGMKSASFFWVGSEVAIQGRHPNYFKYYDKQIPNEERIQTVLEWLKLPANERPNLITLYFSLVDDAGHDFGPNAKETKNTVLEADRLLGLIVAGIGELNLPVNIIVTSDHGMMELQRRRSTYIPLYEMTDLSQEDLILINNGNHAHFYSDNQELIQGIYSDLNKSQEHFLVYLKEDIPPELHFGKHERIGDIFAMANPGYLFEDDNIPIFSEDPIEVFGTHGYNFENCPDMGAIFYAQGPDIKKGLHIPEFKNIHIYPLVAKILGCEYGSIDGDIGVLNNILVD